jgi:hypothetical protein
MSTAEPIPMSDCINTGPAPPPLNYVMPAYGLMRQIGEQKWWAGVFHLDSNLQLNEIEVASHYSGWRYVLKRTEVKDVYEKQTYWGAELVGLSTLDARPAPQSDDEDAEDETETDQPADEPEKEQPIHYCNDRLCNWDCGVLRCGCIDICRKKNH